MSKNWRPDAVAHCDLYSSAALCIPRWSPTGLVLTDPRATPYKYQHTHYCMRYMHPHMLSVGSFCNTDREHKWGILCMEVNSDTIFFFEKKNSLNISNYILKYSCTFEVCRNPRAFMVGTHLHMTCVSFHSLIHKASLAQACFLKQIPSVFRQLRSPAPLFVSPQLVSPCIVPSGLCLVNCSEQRETLNSLSHKIILHSFICCRSLKPRRQKRSLWGTRGRWQRNADKTEMGGMGEREGF